MNNNELNVDAFWERLKTLAKERKVTLEKLCLDIGTLPQNLQNKKFRKTFPSLQELVYISKYLDVPLDYLITGKTDNPYEKRIDELETKLQTIKQLLQ